MKILLTALPFLLSLPLGYLLIELIFYKGQKPQPFVQLFLASGLGLAASGYLTFFSFALLNHLNKVLIVGIHIILILLLFVIKLNFLKSKTSRWNDESLTSRNIGLWIILLAAFIPIWFQAKYYPYGGWDAWSVWNFKAKFLFLAGDKWQNLFDPILWRSSPHYPLMLPLINVWGWIFLKNPNHTVPLITSIAFTFLTAGLLLSALISSTKSHFSIFAPLLFLTLPFYGKLATSQYSDLVLGYYAFASLYCIIENFKNKRISYAVLAGIFLGFLSFTKPEGMILVLIIVGLSMLILLLNRKKTTKDFWKLSIVCLLVAAFFAALPTIIFQIQYSPANQTFINGLTSKDNPSTFYRAKMIGAFILMEFRSRKWNWIWILLLLGMLLSYRRCFRREMIIIPISLLIYLSAVLFYYFLNTYFDIRWWLTVTLNRILFSILPIMTFWIFDSIWREKSS